MLITSCGASKISGWVVSFEIIYELKVMVDGKVGVFLRRI
jgi:hypothetical protein